MGLPGLSGLFGGAEAAAPRLAESRLFNLLSNKPEEGGVIGTLCTLNRIVWALVLVKWINFETWWWFGGGPFAMNLC